MKSYYFSHDSNARHDPKCSALLGDYGAEGYGVFWMMIEILSEQEGYRIRKFNKLYEGLAKQFGIETKHCFDLLQALINDYELLLEDDHYIWSESLLRRMEVKDEKRQKRVEAGRKGGINSGVSRTGRSNAQAMLKQNEAVLEANEPKESKEKKSKEKEIKEEERKEENHAPTSERDSLLKLLNELEVKTTVYGLDQLYSYIGLVEQGVIEIAIKKSAGKHINFALKILSDNVSEGKTKVEQVNPTPKVAPFKGRSDKPSIPIVEQSIEGRQEVTEEQYADVLALAQKMKADREAKERVNRETA